MKRNDSVQTLHAQYACTFRPEPEGGFTVLCPAFPQIVTYGRSLEEARSNAREAIELCLKVYQEEGRSVPASDADPVEAINEVVSVTLARV